MGVPNIRLEGSAWDARPQPGVGTKTMRTKWMTGLISLYACVGIAGGDPPMVSAPQVCRGRLSFDGDVLMFVGAGATNHFELVNRQRKGLNPIPGMQVKDYAQRWIVHPDDSGKEDVSILQLVLSNGETLVLQTGRPAPVVLITLEVIRNKNGEKVFVWLKDNEN